jgi:hypothetical protein
LPPAVRHASTLRYSLTLLFSFMCMCYWPAAVCMCVGVVHWCYLQ